jgi:hypothetical protein
MGSQQNIFFVSGQQQNSRQIKQLTAKTNFPRGAYGAVDGKMLFC